MPTINLSTGLQSDIAAAKDALCAAIIARLDGGAGPAEFRFYTATMAATPDTAIGAQVLLGTAVCSDPCATHTGGVITFAAITEDASTDADGTCTWVRVCDSTGAGVVDGDVTGAAGAGFVKLNTTAIVAGGPLRVLSAVLTVGG